MGTRATIFCGKHKVALYKHWDGDPNTVLPMITEAFKRLKLFGRDPAKVCSDEPDMLLAEIFKCCDGLDAAGGYRLDTAKQLLDTDSQYQYKIKGTTVTYTGESSGTYDASIANVKPIRKRG